MSRNEFIATTAALIFAGPLYTTSESIDKAISIADELETRRLAPWSDFDSANNAAPSPAQPQGKDGAA